MDQTAGALQGDTLPCHPLIDLDKFSVFVQAVFLAGFQVSVAIFIFDGGDFGFVSLAVPVEDSDSPAVSSRGRPAVSIYHTTGYWRRMVSL